MNVAPPADPVLARFVRELEQQAPYRPEGPSQVDLRAHAAEDVEAARWTWAARVVDEYRSVVVFSELLRLLADARAPFSALCAVQRLIGDELRHTALCARVVAWLGGWDGMVLDLGGLGLPPSSVPPGDRAYEVVVRELVVAEGESIPVLRLARDAASEPAVRRVLQTLLHDEARHHVAGRRLRALLAPERAAATREAVRARAARDVAHVRSVYLGATGDEAGRALGASVREEELLAAWGGVDAVPAAYL